METKVRVPKYRPGPDEIPMTRAEVRFWLILAGLGAAIWGVVLLYWWRH